MENFLQSIVQLLAEVGPAADEQASDFSLRIDHHGLRNGGDGIFFGGSAVLIERDLRFQIKPFEQALDSFGIFLHIDGDELDMVSFETMDGFVDLGHSADAGAAPGGKKVEHDHVIFVLAKFEFAAIEEFQLEIGSGLADERALRAGGLVW